jgi:hypothetical protein
MSLPARAPKVTDSMEGGNEAKQCIGDGKMTRLLTMNHGGINKHKHKQQFRLFVLSSSVPTHHLLSEKTFTNLNTYYIYIGKMVSRMNMKTKIRV